MQLSMQQEALQRYEGSYAVSCKAMYATDSSWRCEFVMSIGSPVAYMLLFL